MMAWSSLRWSWSENGTNERSSTNRSESSARLAQQRVVGRDPLLLGLGYLTGRVRDRDGLRPRLGLGRVLGHVPRVGPLVELRRVGDVVPGVRLRLDPEEVLRIPEVVDEVLRRVGDRGEQRRERLLVRLRQRIVRVDDVEGDVAVVGVDDGLDRVPRVVEPLPQARGGRELRWCRPSGRRDSGRCSCRRRRST